MIPIVFSIGGDPLGEFFGSLNRPGGNFTGAVTLNEEVGRKRLELLHELLPAAREIAVLLNPTGGTAGNQLKDLQAAARMLGLELRILQASNFRCGLRDLRRRRRANHQR